MFDLIESSEILLSYNLSKLHLKLSILWWQDSGTFETNIIKIKKLVVAISDLFHSVQRDSTTKICSGASAC